jgi:hypothetical protein
MVEEIGWDSISKPLCTLESSEVDEPVPERIVMPDGAVVMVIWDPSSEDATAAAP